MKIKINKEYQDVDFWSFMKCTFLTQLVLSIFLYAITILLVTIIMLIL